jgi:hypothetical protein
MSFTGEWRELEVIMLSQGSERQTLHAFSHTCKIDPKSK